MHYIRILEIAKILFHRHTLREILWLIDITPELLGNPDCHEPEWNKWKEWRENRMRGRHLDNIIIEIRSGFISDGHYTEDHSTTSLDLFDVGVCLIPENSLEIEYDCWHLWRDEREWTVLQFPTRITLRMEIGEFLELERAFCRCSIEEIAPEEEEVLILRIFLHNRNNLLRILQLFFEFERHFLHLSNNLTNILHLKIPLLTE